ncbi:hypothetical protein F3J16_08375 [Burkholderia sp. Ap-962]|uniref:hypothetical protein n=1 Tax=Burkholderia sp. Ap-962 TaxID=2608333 RepID=UPI001421DD71|nr:hypothetical protein [Burkholderia sp. Ap-962]NIF70202.1 hypothetical protein [Burkholderia sp. Ap-962]
MNTFAIVKDGTVTNVVVWDGVTPWDVPDGCEAVLATAGAAVGGTYDGSKFTPPAPRMSPAAT